MKRKKARWPLEVDGVSYPRDEVVRIVRESVSIASAVRDAVEKMEKSIVAAEKISPAPVAEGSAANEQ